MTFNPDYPDWVRSRTGITLISRNGLDASQHIRLALRLNPKRAHLLVSSILGKHVPVRFEDFDNACKVLAEGVSAVVDNTPVVVMGYAETAVGMGHNVASHLHAPFFQSTRHVLSQEKYIEFSEPHSHASEHYAYVTDKKLVSTDKIVVLVDDEVSTGVTVANTIRALHDKNPHPAYIVATFLDARTSAPALDEVSEELSVPVIVVSLSQANVSLPEGILETAANLLATHPSHEEEKWENGKVLVVPSLPEDVVLPDSVSGCSYEETLQIDEVARYLAEQLHSVDEFDPEVLTHVVGIEEDTYLASKVANELNATFSSTTRSPIFTVNSEDYPVRWKHQHINGQGETRWAYNLPLGGQRVLLLPAHIKEHWNDLVQVDRLVTSLQKCCDTLFIVRLPSSEKD